jgi:hypothetical protein
MCWICDHPEATHEDYLNHLRGLIDAHGWAVQGVERDRIHPPWAYTAGLTAHGRPELVVTGMPVRRAGRLLNEVAAHLMHAEPPRPGEQVRLTGGPLIEIVKVVQPTAHLLQVVHADDAGQWPWDRAYRGVRGGQPVLGPRARRAAGWRRSA